MVSKLFDSLAKRYSDRKIKFSFSEDQIIGMTMWISGMMNSNNVIIKFFDMF